MQEERERLTAHHQEELSGLREQLRNAEIEFQRRSHETTSAHRSREEELTQRLSQTSLTSTENSDLRRQLETAQRDHREELETLRTQHQSNLRGIEERFQSRIETLEKDIRSATEAKERLLSQHREQLEELEQTHRIHTIDLNSQLATQSEELERLRASSPSSGGDSETQRLQTTISKLQRELLGAKDQFNRTKEQLEEALQANIEQENEALKVARQQVVAQQSEIERLTERLESVSSANRGLVRQRDELQIRNTQLLKLVTDKEIEFRNREREITQRFNQRIRELTEEASQLRASNNSFVDENRSLTEKARRLEQEKRALASSNASLREDNTQLREESDDLGRSLQAHVLLVQRKTSEKQAVERQLEESERQASELRTTVRDLEGTQRDLTAENDLHKQMLVQMIGSVSLYHLALQGEDISSVDESTLTAESIKLLAKMKKMPTLLNTVLQQVMESVKAATTQPTETHSDESTPSPALGVSPSVVAVEPSPSVVVSTPIVETENEVTESSTSSDDTDIIAHNRRVPRTVLMPLQRQIRELTEQLDAANAQIRKLKRKATSRGAVARVDTGLKRTPSASATAVH
jgi:chromosome segregation ATPase